MEDPLTKLLAFDLEAFVIGMAVLVEVAIGVQDQRFRRKELDVVGPARRQLDLIRQIGCLEQFWR